MKKLIGTLTMAAASLFCNAQYLDSFDINKSSLIKSSNPGNLIADGITLYFSANDSMHGYEIWAMYGNATEPVRLTDINPGPLHSVIGSSNAMALAKGTFLFSLYDTTNGSEPWFRDKNGGSSMVLDISPGKLSSGPGNFSVYKDKIYFSATNKEYGNEVWMYDPDTYQAERITDINPDSLPSNPRYITGFNNKLYFQAYSNTTGYELYEYNPADKKTTLVVDLRDTTQSGQPSQMLEMGNKLYFLASTVDYGAELYEYDGTNTPKRLTDLNPGNLAGVYSICNMVAFNGKLFFSGYDVTSSGYQLCSYDPATGQASVEQVINSSTTANINYLTVYDNKLYFTANDGVSGIELWEYDGTSAPQRITDLGIGLASAYIHSITATTHALYFSARSSNLDFGIELFRYSKNKVGIANIQFNGDAKIHPNPTQNIAHLQLRLNQSQSLNISVTDMSGRVVYSTGSTLYSASTHTVDIPMRNMPQGNYVYSIKDADGRMMASGKLQKL